MVEDGVDLALPLPLGALEYVMPRLGFRVLYGLVRDDTSRLPSL